LHSLGIRPISNVVDITNLLLMESGHPMHAFDLDRVADARIVIRRAQQAEPFTTLDGTDHRLDPDDLIICDGHGPTALAGVMGGLDSEISPRTRRVLLECAYFAPRGIRRTARRHGMQTESSVRFERGVDWGGVPRVLERAKVLLTELAQGAAVPRAIHARPSQLSTPTMRLRSGRLNALLGVPIDFPQAISILPRLGLEVGAVQGEGEAAAVEVKGASWRPDLKREIDLIEEVARIHGLSRIPTRLPRIVPQAPRTCGRLEREVSAAATSLGLSEALTHAFVSPAVLQAIGAPAPVVRLSNPLSEERSVMRTSLLPGLLEAVRRGRRRGERSIRLYAVGARFLPPTAAPPSAAAQAARPRMDADRASLPDERPCFAAVLAGERPAYLQRPELDVYDAKGVALELVERVTGRVAEVRRMAGAVGAQHLHPRGAAEILVGAERVGTFGPLHPEVMDALDLDGPVQVIELELVAIEALGKLTPTYRPIPRLPAVARDISVEVSEEIPAGSLRSAIAEAAGELCESVELFDVFTGPPIVAGSRSLTFRVVYRDPKASSDPDQARTLTDREVDAHHGQVRAAAEKLGARLRG
jgi:phenylalanyl-tRNA synthetase beta chain